MGGFGSAAAMVQSVKMNLAQRRAKKAKRGIDSAKRVKTEYNFAKVSDKDLEIIKEQIRAKARKRKVVNGALFLLMSFFIIYLLYLAFN